MPSGVRLGIASQTPYFRLRRPVEELEKEHGALPDPVPLSRLERGVDYSLTPGGVGRMIGGLMAVAPQAVHGTWVSLANGFPHDLVHRGFTLSFAPLGARERETYGSTKEVAWEALNGMPPRLHEPLRDTAFETGLAAWSAANTRRILAADAETPFDVFYVNDWQHLPQGRMLEGRPRVMHAHMPVASWTPPGWRRWFLHHVEAFDAVIVSTASYAQALQELGCSRPVHQVYPWLDPREFHLPSGARAAEFAARFGIRDDDEVVLDVARMDPIKGQDRLLRAMPALLRRRPRARLVLVGNGSFSSAKSGIGLAKGPKWRAHLEGLAKELDVEERVVFTGHLPQPLVVAAFHRANVFAFPSVAEGFGLTVAEAWLATTPCVVSEGAGIAELVEEGVNGRVLDTSDAAALAEALADLLGRPEEAARMGEAGRETVLVHCDVRRTVPRVLEILGAYAERRTPDLPEPVAQAG